jgi:serine/threonine protein kinase/Tol biopolymer transport system component
MSTSPGSRLGPYEIVSRIGAGGMGEVFRARDTRLDRSVAIKVLPAEFAQNAQLKLRFEREARAISQLNHPHICTLYDVGDDYLVMELLEGEPLSDRIARGPLPLADVLRYGAQIADALDRAHRAGIVHRDLKPGNIMITKAGAKLLDFGLAKSAMPPSNPDGTTVHHEKALTQEGTILGTFQYMAPEQLEAEEADARTDIFALGAVLYEMSTGRRAFQGKTKTSLIAAIVGGQPQPVSELIPLSPPALDHVIHKCLEKEREDRWQSAHDVAEELKWIATIPATEKTVTSRRTRIATGVAVGLALALAAMSILWMRARNAPQPRAAFVILPPDGSWFDTSILSPDGTMIAFQAQNDRNEGGIYVRRVEEIEARRLTSKVDDSIVAWSPDSKWIAYMSKGPTGRQMQKIAVAGGTPEVLSSRVSRFTGGGAWAPDGTIVTGRVFGEGLMAIRPDGSDPVFITQPDRGRRESFHGWPRLLSDGKRFLYVVHTIAEQKNEIWAGSIDGKLKKQIFRADSLVGIALGHLYFVRDGALYAQKFDEKTLALRGDAKRMVESVAFIEPAITSGASVGANGALLYRPNVERTVEMGWFDRNGRRIEKVFEDVNSYPRDLSRDGTKLVVRRWEPAKGAVDIYTVDLARGIRTRITSGLADHDDPQFSPDGSRIYFVSDRDGPYDLYVQAADGLTPAEALLKTGHDQKLPDVSPDGTTLLTLEFTGKHQNDIYLVPVAAPSQRKLFVGTEANEYGAQFSPDGQWVAYNSDRSGRPEVYLRRVDGGPTTQVSTEGGSGLTWSADGRELYIRTLDAQRVAVPLTFSASGVIAGKAKPLLTPPALDYNIIAETERGLAISYVPDPDDYIDAMHYRSGGPPPD